MALDFPSNPIDNQVYDNFIYNATKGTWRSLSAGSSPSQLTNAVISATASSATNTPLIVNGATSQSANLQEWKNSSGSVLSSIDSSGSLTSDSIRTTNFYLNRQNSAYEGGQINFRRSIDNTDYWLIDTYGNTSTPSLRFFNGTGSMELDGFGRLMTPNQPAFYAQGSGTVYVSGSQHTEYIPLDSALTNIGGHYNTSNSRFTAPVAGTYYFWLQSCTTDASSTGPEIYIYKNGASLNNVSIEYNSAYYNTFGSSYIVTLAQNDYVQLGIVNNNNTAFTIEKGRSRFSGYLIG